MKPAIHTTLEKGTLIWLTQEAEKCKTTVNDIIEKAIAFYRSHKPFDPPV